MLSMKYNFFILLCLAIILSGCDKKLEEINIDPTTMTSQNTEFNYLFTSAELFTAGNSNGFATGIWESSLSYSSTMMQHLSSTLPFGWPGDKYIYESGTNGAYWRSQYSSSIKNIVDIIENVKLDEKRKNLYNISRILKVFLFQRMTDMYGDIPYFEAGLGAINASTNPKYDLQEVIYAHLLAELEDAAQKLDATADILGNADLFYRGDAGKWKKFAYSEMLRLAMRMSKVDPASAKRWSEKAVNGGVMQSNDDNAICPHEAKAANPVTNPIGLVLATFQPSDYRLSETFISFLKVTNDPRLPHLATVAADPNDPEDLGDTDPGIQLGQPNGYDNLGGAEDITNAPNWPGDQNKYSVVNRTTFAREDAPTFILTYAETALLLAEAAQRGWISGDASGYYNRGVKAAILQLKDAGATISEAEADDYLNAHPYDIAKGLEMINTQYWVATFADWNETWCNWRRSGYPQLTEIDYQATPTIGSIPRRFTYPLEEANINPQNYKEAVQRIVGGDKMTSGVWWDVP
jgi:hypothetical protein